MPRSNYSIPIDMVIFLVFLLLEPNHSIPPDSFKSSCWFLDLLLIMLGGDVCQVCKILEKLPKKRLPLRNLGSFSRPSRPATQTQLRKPSSSIGSKKNGPVFAKGVFSIVFLLIMPHYRQAHLLPRPNHSTPIGMMTFSCCFP